MKKLLLLLIISFLFLSKSTYGQSKYCQNEDIPDFDSSPIHVL